MTEKNISEKVSTTYVAPTGHCTIYMMTEENRREKDPFPRVSMGLTVRRKTAKNLAVRRKNERILAVSRKKN